MQTGPILIALFAVFALLCAGGEEREFLCIDKTPQASAVESNANWMKRLDDRAKLSDLSLPGTHNTCALVGGAYAQCQSLALKDQLSIGIRFLDIRCCRYRREFRIYHGMMFQNITFAEVQTACLEFLKAHPSECLVMNVQEEFTPEDDPPPFDEVFYEYIKTHEKLWYLEAAVPTLGDVRGKIVLVGRAKGIGGIQWSSFKLQNDWPVPTALHIREKWTKVKSNLESAISGNAADWHLNFASGAGIAAIPSAVARSINASLFKFLEAPRKQRLGTILMDFPAEKLLDRIIRSNFD